MWRKKKWVIIAVAATILLVGTMGSIALAQTGNSSGKTLLARVATILGIDQQKVEDAFAQAQRDMQSEALDSYLKSLVDQGKITQQQADQYKSWCQSRPDLPAGMGLPFDGGFRHGGFRGGFRGGFPMPKPGASTTPTVPATSTSA